MTISQRLQRRRRGQSGSVQTENDLGPACGRSSGAETRYTDGFQSPIRKRGGRLEAVETDQDTGARLERSSRVETLQRFDRYHRLMRRGDTSVLTLLRPLSTPQEQEEGEVGCGSGRGRTISVTFRAIATISWVDAYQRLI